MVGVFAGDLQTTTPATIRCVKSILDYDGLPEEPSSDVYAQLIEMINSGQIKGDTGPQGPKGDMGADGKTPHIGDNGNWYIGDIDTGKPSRGETVPKPLTYDYMPEGYPSKSVETVTLMEEQTASFSEQEGFMVSILPINPDPTDGQKLTVLWDGVEYNVTVTLLGNMYPSFGNLGMIGFGETTDAPFMYMDQGAGNELWATTDTATSHTIKVIWKKETYKMIDENFLPKYVSYEVQDLTDEEKTIARNNVNALSKDVLVEIPTNIVLASDFERYYEKHKETGLPIKWDGKNITYIQYLGSNNGIKDYVLSIGRSLFRIKEYIYNGEKHLALSNTDSFYNDIYVDQIQFESDIGESYKTISLDSLGNLRTNDGGMVMIWNDGVVVYSCTQGSTKKFKITVDDSGTISATEVT